MFCTTFIENAVKEEISNWERNKRRRRSSTSERTEMKIIKKTTHSEQRTATTTTNGVEQNFIKGKRQSKQTFMPFSIRKTNAKQLNIVIIWFLQHYRKVPRNAKYSTCIPGKNFNLNIFSSFFSPCIVDVVEFFFFFFFFMCCWFWFLCGAAMIMPFEKCQ